MSRVRFGALAAVVALAAGIAGPAGAATVLMQVPAPIFGSAGGPSGGTFDLSPYLRDSDGRQFTITSATLSVKSHSDPHFSAPKTKTTTTSGELYLVSFDPFAFGVDETRTTTIDYVDAVADSLTLYASILGNDRSVSGVVSEILDTTEVVDLGVTEGPWSTPFPLPFPVTARTTSQQITNHKAIYGALDLAYAYDAAGLYDLNQAAFAFYLVSPGLPLVTPDFGSLPAIGEFAIDSVTFAFERIQVAGPPLPQEPWVAVPEPATWAMLLMGFGGLGAVLRRQRRQGVAVA